MQKITSLVIKRPKLVFFVLLLISVASVWRLGDLSLNASLDGLMITADPNKAFYNNIQETFGSDNTVVVFVEDKDLFTAKKLKLIQDVNAKLASIEGVSRVNSLFTLKNFKRSEQGLESALFFENIPDSETELKALQRAVLSNPFARTLVSSDGTAMAMHIHLRRGLTGAEMGLMEAIEEAVTPLKRKAVSFDQNALSFERVFQIGAPYVREALRETIIADQTTLILLVLGVILMFLLVCLKSFSGLIVPLLIAGLSILWTLGLMAAVGWPITVLTAIVPVLIIVFGSVQSSYLLGQYTAGLRGAKDKRQAMLATASKLGLGFFLGSVAVYLGVLSLALYDIKILQQFSAVMAVGLLFHFIIAVALTPLYLLAFGSTEDATESRSLFERIAETLAVAMPANKATVLTLATLLALALGSGTIWLSIDNQPQAFFDERAPIRTRSDIMAQRLPGLQTFTIVFSAEHDGALQDPELLNEIKKVQDFIKQMKLFDASLSIADLLSLLHRELNNGDPRIPPSTALVQQYFADFVSRDDVEQYVSADFKQAVIRVWRRHSASDDFSRVLARLQEFTDTLDKRLSVRFSGADILINDGAKSLPNGQIKSLLSLMIIVFALISLLFMNLKAGLIALTPSFIPLFVLFGLMGYLAIPLNIGTAMVATLMLGIALSHTLHIMIRYNEEARDDSSEKLAMERALQSELAPIIAASVALVAGFAVLLAASLKPIAYFGGLMASLLAVALLANLYVTPKLLTSMRFVTLWGMASVNVGRKILDDCELFKGMHVWQIKQIILLSQVRNMSAGEMFIQQGAIGHEMFVILEGQARVEKTASDGSKQILYTAHEGDALGEVALVSQQQRTASVIADTDLKLLVLEWKTLEQLARFLPMISTRLFLNIARIIGKRFGS